jgi:hypothetical protein
VLACVWNWRLLVGDLEGLETGDWYESKVVGQLGGGLCRRLAGGYGIGR